LNRIVAVEVCPKGAPSERRNRSKIEIRSWLHNVDQKDSKARTFTKPSVDLVSLPAASSLQLQRSTTGRQVCAFIVRVL